MKVFAILPAAGLGTRMAAGHSGAPAKQFLMLAGLPLLIHSLRAFASVGRINSVHIGVRANEVDNANKLIADFGLAARVNIFIGGDTRQETVSRGLASLPCAEDDIVLVHDAVRPLIDVSTIERTIDSVIQHGAAIVALPAIDTIKQVERTAHGAIISSTIPRERIVQAQTPQGFRCGLLRRAFAEAAADGFTGTDEASVVERAGAQVAVVMGSPRNFKVTQPGDLELAEFYLAQKS